MTVEEWLGKDNKLGIDIWKNKYQRNNESFEDWLVRVSGNNKEVAKLIREKKFLPGGRILSNRGITDSKVTYSNCYVISPPEDNLESIYDCCKNLARTYSVGGGCGIDISKLAPNGAKVNNQAKSTSGAVSFMDTFSQVTGQIGQNGRRGALMISIDCHHPDLMEFIDAKTNTDSVTKANISVRVTNDFMKAVVNDNEWVMSFTRPETGETIIKTAKAKDIFDKLCQNNWDWAEPGILFWDNIENNNLLSNNPDFHYAGTNPCAEEPLPAGGSCLLGSINLAEFVKPDRTFDWNSFQTAVQVGVEALNDILDEGLSLHPLAEQRDSVRDWRQIGLGVMGIADMLIKMEIPYNSQYARDFCDTVGLEMAGMALNTSSLIAKNAGSYPKYTDLVIKTKFFQDNAGYDVIDNVTTYGLRNSQLLTIAPTGTLSTMLGVSGGIEPIFANYYTRTTKSLHGHDQDYKVYTPIVKAYMGEHGLKDESELPEWFVTSSDISPADRVSMQATWQKHIDASISSTVNLPEDATIDDVKEIYLKAWRSGLKGITVFRSGCKRAGILTTDSNKKPVEAKITPPTYDSIIPVSRKTIGTTHGDTFCKKCACGTLYITLNRDDDGNLVESFIHTSKGGICQANTSAVNRLVSLNLRSGVKVDEIIDQLKGIYCPACAAATSKGKKLDGISCPDILSRTLQEFQSESLKALKIGEALVEGFNEGIKNVICPECGTELNHEEGCIRCPNCGWSKCS